ncbi:hypothetical protein SDC9_137580 [bioreactor metagenome]|uniref:Uncharacterized protein n=1 Tax=bioreactor metagenome TaxID=1076179 RepID=A0A645DME0_9ZZZZ
MASPFFARDTLAHSSIILRLRLIRITEAVPFDMNSGSPKIPPSFFSKEAVISELEEERFEGIIPAQSTIRDRVPYANIAL